MSFYEFMCGYVVKIIQNTNNLFKKLLLVHRHGVLPKIIVVESRYLIFNNENF
jgi:hypothetical protein